MTALAPTRLAASEVASPEETAAGARVAFVLWNGRLGGAESLTAALAASLRQRGVDAGVAFVCDGDRLSERLDALEVPHSALGLGRGRDVLRHPRAIASLVASIGGDCAVLVSSGYLASSLRLGGYRGPIAAVEHGAVLQVERLAPKQRLLRRFDRLSGVWACDVEVAVSNYVLDALRSRRHAREVVCIRNGVDLERFSPPREEPRLRRPFTVGYAGRLVASKGVGQVIEAFASMAVSDQSQLLIAGEGPEQSALESLVDALDVRSRIEFLGRVDDMAAFWRRCDISVAPSAGWIESFCLSAVEAMACGRPVVASRTGALPEIVRDGVGGVLVDEGDTEALSRALERYACNPSLRRAHGRAARQLCEREYDLAGTTSGYLELIASLLSRGRRAASSARMTHTTPADDSIKAGP